MTETFITSRGTVITVNIPDRTLEEQKIRDREIEQSMISIYRKLEARGMGHIFTKARE